MEINKKGGTNAKYPDVTKTSRRNADMLSGIINVMAEDLEKREQIIELPKEVEAVTEYFWKGRGMMSAPFHRAIFYNFDQDGVFVFDEMPDKEPEASQEEVEVMRKLLSFQSKIKKTQVGEVVSVISELDEIKRALKLSAKR